MREESKRLFIALVAAVTVTALILDYTYAFGFLLGTAISILLYYRVILFVDTVLGTRNAGKGFVLSRFMSSYALMAIPLLLSAIFPQYLNIFATAAGLLSIKITLVLDTLIERRGTNEQSTSPDDSSGYVCDHRTNDSVMSSDDSNLKKD